MTSPDSVYATLGYMLANLKTRVSISQNSLQNSRLNTGARVNYVILTYLHVRCSSLELHQCDGMCATVDADSVIHDSNRQNIMYVLLG